MTTLLAGYTGQVAPLIGMGTTVQGKPRRASVRRILLSFSGKSSGAMVSFAVTKHGRFI
jgi:hypothetical protein